MGYDKYGDIHNQYAALPARMHNSEMWLHGSNGLTSTGTGTQLGGTLTTSSSVTNTTTRKVDFSSYKSTWGYDNSRGYSGSTGPQGAAGYSGIGGHASSRSKAISYTDLSGLSNFSPSSRKPTKGSMGNNVKR